MAKANTMKKMAMMAIATRRLIPLLGAGIASRSFLFSAAYDAVCLLLDSAATVATGFDLGFDHGCKPCQATGVGPDVFARVVDRKVVVDVFGLAVNDPPVSHLAPPPSFNGLSEQDHNTLPSFFKPSR